MTSAGPKLMTQRSNVPSAVTRDANSIDTSTLGTPDAEYLSSGCDIDSNFTRKPLTFDSNILASVLVYPSLS